MTVSVAFALTWIVLHILRRNLPSVRNDFYFRAMYIISGVAVLIHGLSMMIVFICDMIIKALA